MIINESKKIEYQGTIVSIQPRTVPYKGDGSTYDEGWLDDLCTENRSEDD